MSETQGTDGLSASRRKLLVTTAGMAGAALAAAGTSNLAAAATAHSTTSIHQAANNHHDGAKSMSYVTTKNGARIFFKDWGTGQPVVFSHGWPLDADAWDPQMLFLVQKGYRVIAHDRRGHGRSGQPGHGNDMDTYADDLDSVIYAIDLNGATLVGHSTGGVEIAHYVGRHGTGRIEKMVLIGAVPPLMLKTEANPTGLPMSGFDGIRAGTASNG